jgi:hypothetical protein
VENLQTNKIYNNQTKIETKKKETKRGAYLEYDEGKRLPKLNMGFDLKIKIEIERVLMWILI